MATFSKIVQAVVLILLVAALGIFGVPRLFGVKMFNVITGSMTPKYPVNTLVYDVPTPFDQLKVGDVITFLLPGNEYATHRIVEIDKSSQSVVTKGDANQSRDGSTAYKNIIGVVRFSIPKIGSLLESVSTTKGRIITYIVLAIVVLLTVMLGFVSKPAKEEKQEPIPPPIRQMPAGNFKPPKIKAQKMRAPPVPKPLKFKEFKEPKQPKQLKQPETAAAEFVPRNETPANIPPPAGPPIITNTPQNDVRSAQVRGDVPEFNFVKKAPPPGWGKKKKP